MVENKIQSHIFKYQFCISKYQYLNTIRSLTTVMFDSLRNFRVNLLVICILAPTILNIFDLSEGMNVNNWFE
jgi:hypothetical protein